MINPIHIACTIDNNYAQHCCVMLASLFSNNINNDFIIHVVTNGLNKKTRNRLKLFVEKNNKGIYFYTLDESILINAPVTHHISLATYYRILLPEILPKDINKVIFLDSDMIVLDDLSSLWELEIDNYYIGACCEFPSEERKIKLGLKPNSLYFNAGLMLINLTKWRLEEVSKKALKFINTNPEKIQFWDQDALNVIFEDNWMELSHYWNVNHKFYSFPYSEECFNISENDYFNFAKNPGILHYTGSSKPWEYDNNHPKKEEYYNYLKNTPWKGFKPRNPYSTFNKILTKIKKQVNLIIGLINN